MHNPFSPFLRSRRKLSGFTLVELLITMSIAAVLLTLAVPSFRSFILSQRVKTASFDLIYTLNLARSEAIKRNTGVVVAPASGGWNDGWTVSATSVLHTQGAYPSVTISGPSPNLTYAGNGRLTASATSFEITDGTNTRCISFSVNGLPSSKTGSC